METPVVQEEKKSNDKLSQPVLNQRLKALALDTAIALGCALLLNTLGSFLIGKFSQTYNDNYNRVVDQIALSGLANNETSDAFTFEELTSNEGEQFLKCTKSFYIEYLNNLNTGTTYDVNYINTNVLKIGSEQYFVYKTDGETNLTNELGVPNHAQMSESNGNYYIKDGSHFGDFIKETYTNMIKTFNSLDVVNEPTNKMNEINNMNDVISYLLPFIVTFAVFPSIFKETLGKKLFKVKVVNENNEKPSFLIYLLRTLPLSLAIVGISFLPPQLKGSFSFFIIMAVGVAFILFTKSHRAIHDFLAKTHVVSVEENNNGTSEKDS